MRYKFRTILGAAACLALPATFITSPADAATEWKLGAQIAPNPGYLDYMIDTFYDPGCPGQTGMAGVQLEGDRLYVYDNCADGRAPGVEYWVRSNPSQRYACVNRSGEGTWAACTFDWPETDGILVGTVLEGNTLVHRDDGNSVTFSQEGNNKTPVIFNRDL